MGVFVEKISIMEWYDAGICTENIFCAYTWFYFLKLYSAVRLIRGYLIYMRYDTSSCWRICGTKLNT